MSDLTATNCGCSNNCNNNCGNNFIWIILLLFCCNGNGNGLLGGSCGCDNNNNNNNCGCDIIILILLLSCCGGNNGCFGC